jgi:hypothetical protein
MHGALTNYLGFVSRDQISSRSRLQDDKQLLWRAWLTPVPEVARLLLTSSSPEMFDFSLMIVAF